MKFIFTLAIICAAFSSVALPQMPQDEPQRFTYRITGSVLDNESQPMANVSVWFVPAVRPIQGRIPRVVTDSEGKFSLTAKDVPDKYRACASTLDSPFLIVQDEFSGKQNRVVCTETLEFIEKNESREVTIKFDSE